MHNGNGHGTRHGNGNGKRWLLIGLLILGGFWLVSDAYSDGFRNALIQTGRAENARFYRGGPDFPWELLILGGIGYVAWRKGAFDRLGGPGGPFGPGGNGVRSVQKYGGAGQAAGPAFRGPRAVFEQWHRESHEAERARYAAPAASPPAPHPPAMPQNPAAGATGNGAPAGYTPTPPPPPPAPDYWASMTRPVTPDAGTAPAPAATQAPAAEPDNQPGATGPALERW